MKQGVWYPVTVNVATFNTRLFNVLTPFSTNSSMNIWNNVVCSSVNNLSDDRHFGMDMDASARCLHSASHVCSIIFGSVTFINHFTQVMSSLFNSLHTECIRSNLINGYNCPFLCFLTFLLTITPEEENAKS